MGVLSRLRALAYMDCNLRYELKKSVYQNRADYLTRMTLQSTSPGISSDELCDKEVVVSLTTHSRRILDVYLAIESIMQQSMKPNRIVLWLDESFKHSALPLTLIKQQKRGLEIRFCKDIGSYKKLIYSLRTFPDSIIITIDDDALYDFDIIERLINGYIHDKRYIYCNRMHRIKLNEDGTPAKYREWYSDEQSTDVSPLNFCVGSGGILYPPHCFNDEVFNEKVFSSICKYEDDVWFKAMSLYNGVQCRRIQTRHPNGYDYLSNENMQNIGLYLRNIVQSQGNVQLKAVFDKYNLYPLLNPM